MDAVATSSNSTTPTDTAISFKEFLETCPPSASKQVTDLWRGNRNTPVVVLSRPDIRIHCRGCDGERTFRCNEGEHNVLVSEPNGIFLLYICGDCQAQSKEFALNIEIGTDRGHGTAYKHGEMPPFGIPVPKKVLKLFGKEGKAFLKGRQCENQGLGIGTFAYYRRMVENHKNEIFDEIIRVCETLKTSSKLIEELGTAKHEVSFTKAVEDIKTELPDGLLIDGHNPLTALHGALSKGLHNESDEECLASASAVRLVLTDLVEKMSMLRQDKAELSMAVKLLLSKKSGA